jgi:tetratricopeptide (TPR) repeat protein
VHRVDALSDIYSLGATLYVKATGHPPFRADNLIDMLHAVIHDEPPLPRRYRADIPRDLESVIMRCMRKRRDERFASMQQVIEALDGCSSNTREYVVGPWFSAFVRQRVEDVPEAPENSTPSEHDWLPALEVAQDIAAWDTQLYRVSGDLTRHFPRLDALIMRLGDVLEAEPASGWARFYRGVAWFRRGNLQRALDDMERSIDRVRDLAGAYFELGRLYLAVYLDEHRTAHHHLSKAGTDDQLRAARSRLAQASIAFQEASRLRHELPGWQLQYAQAVYKLAEGSLPGCIATCDEILAGDPDLEEVWKLKGDAERRSELDPVASYTRALETRRTYYEAALALGEVHLAAGRLADARHCLARALEINSELAQARVMMARTCLVEFAATGSIETLRLGLEQAQRVSSDDQGDYDAAVTLAEFELAVGRAARDVEAFGRALAALERASHLDGCGNRVSYLQARARLERAQLSIAAGLDVAAARADLEAVLAVSKEPWVQLHDHGPWREVIAEADRALASLSGDQEI